MNIVFFHANCCDGLFGAYAAWKQFQGKALLIPIDYSRLQKQTPDEFISHYLIENFDKNKRFSSFAYELIDVSNYMKEVNVYFIDIAPDIEKYEVLTSMFKKVTVLDHHQTAKEMYLAKYGHKAICATDTTKMNTHDGKGEIFFANNCCGSMLAEKYFTGTFCHYNELVNDYDMWIKKIPVSDAFVAGIMALNVNSIQQLHANIQKGIHLIIEKGETVLTVRERRTSSCCTRAVPVQVEHNGKMYNAALVNAELDLSSILGNTLIEKHGYEIAIVYSIKSPTEVGFSVRSKEGLDSTFLSKPYGGGGHACASGFGGSLKLLTIVLQCQKWVIED